MSTTATRVVKYLRISADHAGDEHGVANQDADCDRYSDSRGLTVVGRYCDNDISATSGKKRPDYLAMMAAAERREFDAILVWQTSRLWRNRRERADAIEILRKAGISVIAVKGPSLDMSTAYGRGMAAMLGEFDTMEAEVKSERQQLAAEQSARNGQRWTSCPRPFGYQADHVTPDPVESKAVSHACRAILGGSTITAVTDKWNAEGLRPSRAPFGPLRPDPFTRTSVRGILMNPRIAGLSAYKGDVVGAGQWEAIVAEETWRAVIAILGNPARKPSQGVRTLLGALARCQCGNPVSGGRNQYRHPVYRCNPATRTEPGPHVKVRSEPVDEFVESVVIARLSRPDIAQLIKPASNVDVAGLQSEASAIRVNLDEMAADRALGLVTRSQMLTATDRGNARLAEITLALADAGSGNVLTPFVAAENVRKIWDSLDAPRKRAVIRVLAQVTLNPAGQGARVFDPETVIITWV